MVDGSSPSSGVRTWVIKKIHGFKKKYMVFKWLTISHSSVGQRLFCIVHPLQSEMDAALGLLKEHAPPSATAASDDSDCTYVAKLPVAPHYRLQTPDRYANCLNCDSDDPISLDRLKDSRLSDLVVLPSGNCTERQNLIDYSTRAPTGTQVRDPLNRDIIIRRHQY